MRCQKCGAYNSADARFCNKCGARLAGEQDQLRNQNSDFSPLYSAGENQERKDAFSKGQNGLRSQPKPKQKKMRIIPILALITAGVCLFGFFVIRHRDNPVPSELYAQPETDLENTIQTQIPLETQKPEVPETVWTAPQVLETEAAFDREEDVPRAPEELVLKNYDPMGRNPNIFGTKLRKTDIESVTFLDSLDRAPQDAVDVSEARAGRVLLWSENGYEGKKIFIAGDGRVFLPRDSSFLFGSQYSDTHTVSRYDILETIDFNTAVDTSMVKTMCAMFQFSGSLKKLDLRGFDTENTEDMSYMFCGCKSLESLDVSSFETGNVENMSAMFNGCASLENLDISNFDTRNVSLMTWMFGNCRGLTLLDLSDMRTDSVKFENTGCMFKGCTEYFQILTNDSILRERYEVFLEKLPY